MKIKFIDQIGVVGVPENEGDLTVLQERAMVSRKTSAMIASKLTKDGRPDGRYHNNSWKGKHRVACNICPPNGKTYRNPKLHMLRKHEGIPAGYAYPPQPVDSRS